MHSKLVEIKANINIITMISINFYRNKNAICKRTNYLANLVIKKDVAYFTNINRYLVVVTLIILQTWLFNVVWRGTTCLITIRLKKLDTCISGRTNVCFVGFILKYSSRALPYYSWITCMVISNYSITATIVYMRWDIVKVSEILVTCLQIVITSHEQQ